MPRAIVLALLAGAMITGPAHALRADEVSDQRCKVDIDLHNREVTEQTQGALHAAWRFILDFALGREVKETRNSILIEFPNADQLVVVFTFYRDLCLSIVEDEALSPKEVRSELRRLQQDLLQRVYAPVVATTQGWFVGPDEPRLFLAAASTASAAPRSEEPRFLKPPPFVINEANKYFVIVASTRSVEEAKRMAHRFKQRRPDQDFAIYAPYGDNPYYGVMMATWVSREVAQEAVAIARRAIADDAYIWACPRVGDAC